METQTVPEKSQEISLKKKCKKFWDNKNSESNQTNRHGQYILFCKELTDHLESRRCQILFFLLLIVSTTALRGGLNTISEAAKQASTQGQALTEYIFLSLFTTGGNSVYSFSAFLGFLGPLLGIMLGFDAINNEKAQGTLNRLASQPIYRDTIIRAKFEACAVIIFLIVFSIGTLFTANAIIISGISPKAEEFVRILLFLLATSIYVCVWLSISILFSTLCSHAATSALSSIALWLFMTMFLSLIASAIAGVLYPANNQATMMSALQNYQTAVNINRISPYYLFNEVTQMLMNPNVKSLNIMSILNSQDGAVASYLSLGQSILQIWPQIVAMFAETAIGFSIAYLCFMNKEIRA